MTNLITALWPSLSYVYKIGDCYPANRKIPCTRLLTPDTCVLLVSSTPSQVNLRLCVFVRNSMKTDNFEITVGLLTVC